MRVSVGLLFAVLLATAAEAEISFWKMGGSGLAWNRHDTTRVMIEFDTAANAIQPIYFTQDQNMLLEVEGWSELKTPRELGYIDGHQPRLWLNDGTNVNLTSYYDSPLYVDGLRSTYNTARFGWWTIDIGVPMPAAHFGFTTPTEGFRSDGAPLHQDPVPAFEVTVSEESDPILEERGYHRLETLIANVQENFEPEVDIEFPQQYVRFVRYNRNHSVIDDQVTSLSLVARGTISEFALKGQGVPKRVIYRTRILDIGREMNFGRLFFKTTALRMVDGTPTRVEDAEAFASLEGRTGRDEDPNIYREYTDSGKEFEVSRQRYEHELRLPETEGILVLDRRPGLRASINYDQENWSFWSSPIQESGARLDLRNGSYLQLHIRLESRAFDDWVRLDSLWIETSPPLADQVVGELARLDDLQPARGFTQVELGQRTEFAYDVRTLFTSASQDGFDGVGIRTGSKPRFIRLEMGEPPVVVEPVAVEESESGLVVMLPERVSRSRNEPVRVIFDAEVFLQATTFEGEVFDSAMEALPQPIEAGDAGEAISTSSLRVLGESGKAPEVIQDLSFSTSVITPNGDGINDRLEIGYKLFNLPAPIPVEVNIYDLAGARIARIDAGEQGAGPQRVLWDGSDKEGNPLAPGLYLVDLNLQAELKVIRHLQPVGVVY